MGASRYVTIKIARIIKETDKAFLVELEEPDDGEEEIWIPFSQIADPDEYEEGDELLDLSITEWFAKQRDLKYED